MQGQPILRRLPDSAALEAAAETFACLAARLLGPDGGTLGRCLNALAARAAVALAGCGLVARGK